MEPALGVVSAIALVLFIVIRWQQLWPKFQMVLMVVIGWGLGGLVGSYLGRLIDLASNLSSTWGQILLGAAFPAALAVASLTIFIVFIWPDRKVPTGPVTWLVLIASLLVVPSLAMLPSVWGSVETVMNGVA